MPTLLVMILAIPPAQNNKIIPAKYHLANTFRFVVCIAQQAFAMFCPSAVGKAAQSDNPDVATG
jgi:hypothetical protein